MNTISDAQALTIESSMRDIAANVEQWWRVLDSNDVVLSLAQHKRLAAALESIESAVDMLGGVVHAHADDR